MNNQPKHSPLPWSIDGVNNWILFDANDVAILQSDPDVAPEVEIKNADFIVRAVNCHYELLRACNASLIYLKSTGCIDVVDLTKRLTDAITKAERK